MFLHLSFPLTLECPIKLCLVSSRALILNLQSLQSSFRTPLPKAGLCQQWLQLLLPNLLLIVFSWLWPNIWGKAPHGGFILFEVIKSITVEKMPQSRGLFRSRSVTVACPMEQEVEGKRLAQVIKLKVYPSDSSFKWGFTSKSFH